MNKRSVILGALLAALLATVPARPATLQRMSLDEMTGSATAIVRARVTESAASFTGPTIYTHYRLEALEVWKGRATAEVMVPGGTVGGMRQSFPGVPELVAGSEYVLFLWKSPGGIVHLIGLTQGMFRVSAGSDGIAMASRPVSGELMLDAKGRKVADQAVHMRLADMKSHVGGAAQ